jgi:myo-inositol catabolism protein IolC
MTEETLEKLAQLLEQDQFELLIPEKIRTESGRISDKASASMDIPLVYRMWKFGIDPGGWKVPPGISDE